MATIKPELGVALLGPGLLGSALAARLVAGEAVDLRLVAGQEGDGTALDALAAGGVETSELGVDAVLDRDDVEIVFDATAAQAHIAAAPRLREAGKRAIDLTPAAIGPYVVPAVNLEEHLDADNVNMVSCGGQATIPFVHAIDRVADVA